MLNSGLQRSSNLFVDAHLLPFEVKSFRIVIIIVAVAGFVVVDSIVFGSCSIAVVPILV